MKKTIIILALIISVFIPSITSAQITQSNIQSVVQVKIYNNSGNLVSWGSGVSDYRGIITNYHVVEDLIKYPNSYIAIICSKQSTYLPLQCNWTANLTYSSKLTLPDVVPAKYSKELDIAILHLTKKYINGEWVPFNMMFDPIPFGVIDFFTYGYALENLGTSINLGSEINTLGFPDYANGEMSYAKGYMTRFDYSYKDMPTIVTDAQISFGNSGGAAFDKNGKFIGITSAGIRDEDIGYTYEGYIVPVTTINYWFKYYLGEERYNWHGQMIIKYTDPSLDSFYGWLRKTQICRQIGKKYDFDLDDCVPQNSLPNNTNNNPNNETNDNSIYRGTCMDLEKKYSGGTLSYRITDQSPYPSTLKVGESVDVWIEVENTGTATWHYCGQNPMRLGAGSKYGNANQQRDYHSEFYNLGTWLSDNRPADISDSEVATGQKTKFQFKIKAPNTAGLYKAYFTPVLDGISWLEDRGIYWQIEVSSN